MNIKMQFALMFAVGLLSGIVVESHVLSPSRQSDQMASDAASNSVGHRTAPSISPVNSAGKLSKTIVAEVPQISVDAPSFNFGDRDAGEVVEHTFTLKNQGKGTLLIDRVLTSCGCTTTELASKSIPPGGSAELHVKLNLRSQQGPQNRSFLVQSNDPEKPNLPLALVGNAIYHVALSPSRVALDDAENDEPYTTTVSVRADRTIDTLSVKGTETSGENVVAEVEPLEAGRHYLVKLKVTPQQDAKELQGWVRLITDHPGEYKAITIPIGAAPQMASNRGGNSPALPQNMGGPSLTARVGETLELEGMTLNGAPITLTSFAGKPTAVIFWASTCNACRKELGELKQLHADYHEAGFEVLGVSLDKSIERRQEFLDEMELPWDTVISKDEGTGIAFARRYNVKSIPSVVLLDRSGKIIAIDKRGTALRQAVSEMISSSDGA